MPESINWIQKADESKFKIYQELPLDQGCQTRGPHASRIGHANPHFSEEGKTMGCCKFDTPALDFSLDNEGNDHIQMGILYSSTSSPFASLIQELGKNNWNGSS